MKKAFTILELAIVLVIVALIVGGVLVGQDLIKEAQINGTAAEMQRIMAGYNQYKEKYNATPGDHANAFDYFGANCKSGGGGIAAECNGNGNGILVDNITGSSSYGETYMMFRHLYLAGFYNQNLTGIHSNPVVSGTNTPKTPLDGAAIWVFGWNKYSYFRSNSSGLTGGSTANILNIGESGTYNFPYYPILTPVEAKQIDTKLDDGSPGTGIIIAGHTNSGCASATDTTNYNTYMKTSTYTVATTTKVCNIGAILEDGV